MIVLAEFAMVSRSDDVSCLHYMPYGRSLLRWIAWNFGVMTMDICNHITRGIRGWKRFCTMCWCNNKEFLCAWLFSINFCCCMMYISLRCVFSNWLRLFRNCSIVYVCLRNKRCWKGSKKSCFYVIFRVVMHRNGKCTLGNIVWRSFNEFKSILDFLINQKKNNLFFFSEMCFHPI